LGDVEGAVCPVKVGGLEAVPFDVEAEILVHVALGEVVEDGPDVP
jgi:hypothetical protein